MLQALLVADAVHERDFALMFGVNHRQLYCLDLLHHGLAIVGLAVTPIIFGIILVGLALAVLQGAFQIEDSTLAMGAKLAIVLLMAGSGLIDIYVSLSGLATDWLHHLPDLINRPWS